MDDKSLFERHKAADGLDHKAYMALKRKIRRKQLRKLKKK